MRDSVPLPSRARSSSGVGWSLTARFLNSEVRGFRVGPPQPFHRAAMTRINDGTVVPDNECERVNVLPFRRHITPAIDGV